MSSTDMHSKNCSLVCRCNDTASATARPDEFESEVSAFMYIVVVLSFYALSMVLLMVKYIKREREEALYDHYFLEYVKRENFNAKTSLQNRKAAKRNMILSFLVGTGGQIQRPGPVEVEIGVPRHQQDSSPALSTSSKHVASASRINTEATPTATPFVTPIATPSTTRSDKKEGFSDIKSTEIHSDAQEI